MYIYICNIVIVILLPLLSLFNYMEDTLLQSCVTDFFMNPSFQNEVDTFIKNNCKLFNDTEIYLEDSTGGVELENVGVREHTHEHMDCFQQFTILFDKNLDTFLESKNVNRRQFMKICQKSYKSAQEDGQDNMGTMLVDLLLATSEYDTFCVMMSNEYKERSEKEDFDADQGGGGKSNDDHNVHSSSSSKTKK